MFYAVASTKGGVGKTTIAQQLIAPYLHNKNKETIEVIELDNNNKSSVLINSEVEKIISLTLNHTDNILLDKFADVIAQDKDVVIDIGGGDDTRIVLDALRELRLEDEIVFFIPVLRDLSNEKNVIDTWAKIREWNLETKIYFVLNKYSNEDEFENILNKLKEVKDENIKILKFPDTPLFDAIAKEFKKSVYEITLSELDNTQAKIKLVEAAKSGDKNRLIETKKWIKTYDECKKFVDYSLNPIFRNIFDKQIKG